MHCFPLLFSLSWTTAVSAKPPRRHSGTPKKHPKPRAGIALFGCSVSEFIAPYCFVATSNVQVTNSSSGNINAVCHFELVSKYPNGTCTDKKATTQTGFPCSIGGNQTLDSNLVITPSGQGLLVCKLNGASNSNRSEIVSADKKKRHLRKLFYFTE